MSNAHPDKQALRKERDSETSMLKWVVSDNRAQAEMGHGYINENGLRSQIWSQSPLVDNEKIEGNKANRADGCAHGLESKKGEPLQKAYRLDSNIKMAKTAKRCPGHGLGLIGRHHAACLETLDAWLCSFRGRRSD